MQDAEILRRERELIATVLKQAEIERQRIETLADAEKQRLIDRKPRASAAAIRAQGEAEAEIIFKKGEAEAKAMNVKAEAYQEYNQAAVVDKLITGMPEVVRALAAPLANVDKITDRLHRQRRCRRHEQDHRRHDRDGGAGSGAVRGAVGHADVRICSAKVRQIGDKAPEAGRDRRRRCRTSASKESHHGTSGTRRHAGPGESQRPDR